MRIIFSFIISVFFLVPMHAHSARHAKLNRDIPKQLRQTETHHAHAGVMEDLSSLAKRSKHFSDDEWNFVLGYTAYLQKNWRAAVQYFRAVEEAQFLLNDHLLYYQAAAKVKLQDFLIARKLLDRLVLQYPDSIWQRPAKFMLAQVLVELGLHKEAQKHLRAYQKLEKSSSLQREAKLVLVRSYIDTGKGKKAAALLSKLALRSQNNQEYLELMPLIARVKNTFNNDLPKFLSEPKQQYLLAKSFEGHSNWEDAASKLELLLKREDLNDSIIAQSKWVLGLSLVRLHYYQAGVKLLEEARQMPESKPFREKLLARLAMTYAKLNRYDKSKQIRKQMFESEPQTQKNRRKYLSLSASLAFAQGKYANALADLQKVIELKPRGKRRLQIMWKIAWCYLQLDEAQLALKQFDHMMQSGAKRYRMHDRVRYWQGRALEKFNKKKAAKKIYRGLVKEFPVGYYRELARRRLKSKQLSPAEFVFYKTKSSRKTSRWKPEIPAAHAAINKSIHLARALLLSKLGLHSEVGKELKAISKNNKAISKELIIYLAAKNHAHDHARVLARIAFGEKLQSYPKNNGFARFVWEQFYPEAYQALVEYSIGKDNLDPRLVYSIMRTESVFKPEVVSPAGAIGLMQLMPTTANKLYQENGARDEFDCRMLYLPAVNIDLGVKYLQKLKAVFPDNPVAWIASYNAGEEAVSRWLKVRSSYQTDEFVEEIPYAETNAYVKKVLTAFWAKKQLYKN